MRKNNPLLFSSLLLLILWGCTLRLNDEITTSPQRPPYLATVASTSTQLIIKTRNHEIPTITKTKLPATNASVSTNTLVCSTFNQLPLTSTILTPKEVLEEYPAIGENHWTETADTTRELIKENHCLYDCAKSVWGPNKVTIVLINGSTAGKANSLVDVTSGTFTNVLDESDRINLSVLPDNVLAAYYYPRDAFVLLYSYGPIFVFIESHPPLGFDDYAGEFDLIALLGRMQMEKLCMSGYMP